MNLINEIELNKEYSTTAFLKILKIGSMTFSKNKERYLELFKNYFDYEYYQKKKNSNRWYFKIKEILEDEEIDLFYRLWKCSENLEEEALELEMYQEGELSLEAMKQGQLSRYIAAKNEFRHYTGKYPMLMPLREKKGVIAAPQQSQKGGVGMSDVM